MLLLVLGLLLEELAALGDCRRLITPILNLLLVHVAACLLEMP